jgi:hypothetical protein
VRLQDRARRGGVLRPVAAARLALAPADHVRLCGIPTTLRYGSTRAFRNKLKKTLPPGVGGTTRSRGPDGPKKSRETSSI